MSTRTRVALTVAVILAAACAWVVVPHVVATAQRLDHPAWDRLQLEPPFDVVTQRTSWWPPGAEVSWTGRTSGSRFTNVDPWGSRADGHAWTVMILVMVTAALLLVWRGRPSRWLSGGRSSVER